MHDPVSAGCKEPRGRYRQAHTGWEHEAVVVALTGTVLLVERRD